MYWVAHDHCKIDLEGCSTDLRCLMSDGEGSETAQGELYHCHLHNYEQTVL